MGCYLPVAKQYVVSLFSKAPHMVQQAEKVFVHGIAVNTTAESFCHLA
jgi:hypothetical protein